MGKMENNEHDGECSRLHYCENHCDYRHESEAPMGCTQCPFDDDPDERDIFGDDWIHDLESNHHMGARG